MEEEIKSQRLKKVREEKSSISLSLRLKKLLLKYKWIHFWGVPFVFFLSYASFFVYGDFVVSGTDFYFTIYPYISEIYGYSLYVCGVLIAIAILYDGCMWHFASIFGMVTNNILASVFANDGWEDSNRWGFVSMSVWCSVIIFFIIKEEIWPVYRGKK